MGLAGPRTLRKKIEVKHAGETIFALLECVGDVLIISTRRHQFRMEIKGRDPEALGIESLIAFLQGIK